MESSEETSLLEKLDAAVPNHLTRFDAFPKLPSTYKQRSGSRGLLTLVLGFITFLLVLNDIGEYIWGWPDYEFSVDNAKDSYMSVNVDLVVNMPCQFLSVDLRDAVGDRLYLSQGFHRDGVSIIVSDFIPLLTLHRPSLMSVKQHHSKNTPKPSQPAKPLLNPENPVVSSPSSGGAHQRTGRRITINRMGPRVGFMGRLTLRRLLLIYM